MTHHGCKTPRQAWLLTLGVLALASAARADEPFDYFVNSWNVVGLRNYGSGARVTPDNAILLAGKSKLSFRYGRQRTPLSRQQTKTALDGWIPVMEFSARDDSVRYDFQYWATPLPSVKDWQAAFDWPTEGENFLVWAVVTATNTGAKRAEARLLAEQSGENAPSSREYSWQLEPSASAVAVIRAPMAAVRNRDAFENENHRVWLERTIRSWKDVMDGAARIEVPCKKATEALLAAHVCQLITAHRGELHCGVGFYDQFYIRDGAYQIMELEEAGLLDAAAKAIEFFLQAQRPYGRFETQEGQFDANGQALWAILQYWRITGDRAWLERAYPPMRKAVDWTMQARRRARADSPYAGLLSAAPADGEWLWDGKNHIVGYDFWNLRGILCTATAAGALGKTSEAEDLLKEARLYRKAMETVWKRLGIEHFPPSWENAGTHWGNTEILWPTEIFASDDSRVTTLLKEVRTRHLGGFVEGTMRRDAPDIVGGPEGILPYMSAYSTMAMLVLGRDEQVVEDFYWYLLHSTATNAFPEGVFFKHRTAWLNTIPHATGASNYAILLRHMLLHEQNDELHLLSAVPDGWLADGQQIRIERAPTHFGPMSLRVRGTKNGVEITLDPPKREPPKKIVLHLPQSRPLTGTLDGVRVVLRPDQKQRWDFPMVVDLYRKQSPPLVVAEPRPRETN